MSTIDRGPAVAVPPLVAGERLDAATFHERYEAMPPSTRAELIGGVVHMPSPLHLDHGSEGFAVGAWLGIYAARTPGVGGADSTSTRLEARGEVQPISASASAPARGAKLGRPASSSSVQELIVEVARSSRRIDLGPKKDHYGGPGPQYLVVALDPDEIHWFVLRDGRLARQAVGDDGIYRSEVFPGLWLDASAPLRRGPGGARGRRRPRRRHPRARRLRGQAGTGEGSVREAWRMTDQHPGPRARGDRGAGRMELRDAVRLGSFLAADAEELDVEDEDRVRRDAAAGAGVGAVGEVGGDEELYFDPTFICWRPSVQPLITSSRRNVIGSPRLIELSKTVWSSSLPS